MSKRKRFSTVATVSSQSYLCCILPHLRFYIVSMFVVERRAMSVAFCLLRSRRIFQTMLRTPPAKLAPSDNTLRGLPHSFFLTCISMAQLYVTSKYTSRTSPYRQRVDLGEICLPYPVKRLCYRQADRRQGMVISHLCSAGAIKKKFSISMLAGVAEGAKRTPAQSLKQAAAAMRSSIYAR